MLFENFELLYIPNPTNIVENSAHFADSVGFEIDIWLGTYDV